MITQNQNQTARAHLIVRTHTLLLYFYSADVSGVQNTRRSKVLSKYTLHRLNIGICTCIIIQPAVNDKALIQTFVTHE